MSGPLTRLSEHAASWRGRDLTPALDRAARRALLDWFAAMLPGLAMDPGPRLAAALAHEQVAGGALAYVDGGRYPPRTAALLNGVASHSAEFDDIYRDAGYHPGSPTIAAALAIAQWRGAGMADLLRALVAGYEVGCRIGVAVQPSHYRYWHTTGTVGTFGAAAAASVLLGLDAGRTAHALATAGTMASGLQQAFRDEGMSKPIHSGHAAEAGTLAALAAAHGVTGSANILDGPAGFAAATSEDRGKWDRALEGLGERHAIIDMTFKAHGCCGHIFAALDGLDELRRAHGFGADAVEAVEVAGYPVVKEVCDRPNARTAGECRFSVQYCVAAFLRLGSVRIRAFEPENLADPAIRADMRKVSVRVDPESADAYPGRRPSRVAVRLADGRRLETFRPTRKGDPDAPLSDEELGAKFRDLAIPVVGEAEAARLETLILRGDALPGEVHPLAPAGEPLRRAG